LSLSRRAGGFCKGFEYVSQEAVFIVVIGFKVYPSSEGISLEVYQCNVLPKVLP
jgi:hypothetical protein